MKLVLLMVTIFGSAACTTMRPGTLPAGYNDLSAVAVGDHVRVTKKNGDEITLDVTAVTASSLEGTNRSGDVFRVALEELDSLAVRRPAPGRTGALAGALGFGLLVIHDLRGLDPFSGL